MKVEELYKTPKWAGIYYFKNTINNKYYIGQAVMLRKRVLHHLSNFNNNRYDAPLYRAFRKYSFEPFEFGILEEFKSGLSKEELKKILDEKEIYYIGKYNSYGATGYNQTKGGDAGVLGFKMNEGQREKISKAVQQRNYETEHPVETWVKARNISNNHEIVAITEGELSRCLCGNSDKLRASIHRCLRNDQHICQGYVIAYYLEEYPSLNVINSGKFKSKLTTEAMEDLYILKEKEFIQKYKICRKTYYNWKKLICKNS